MRQLTIAASVLAIFLLVIASIASANTPPKPGAEGSCRSCHPYAHPADWALGTHSDFAGRGLREMQGCILCHSETYCGYCHQVTPAAAVQR
jgi:hypothetical protein